VFLGFYVAAVCNVALRYAAHTEQAWPPPDIMSLSGAYVPCKERIVHCTNVI